MGRHGYGPPPGGHMGPGWVGGHGGPHGRGGPPPWLAGIFGMGAPPTSRGPRARRGDVRAAILDVLRAADEAGEPINGYQIIQQIGDRSEGAWRPSPGSVYPTVQQLQDEGLVENDDERGRRTLRLTDEGRAWCAEHADELTEVWAPFERDRREEARSEFADLKPEIGQVMSAIWQIATVGTERQQRAAIDILVDARRRLYGVLATDDHEHDDNTDTRAGEES